MICFVVLSKMAELGLEPITKLRDSARANGKEDQESISASLRVYWGLPRPLPVVPAVKQADSWVGIYTLGWLGNTVVTGHAHRV